MEQVRLPVVLGPDAAGKSKLLNAVLREAMADPQADLALEGRA
jgi:ABC-type cobalamin/Fe3+-siderophores transport system ATPase subunit